MAFLRDALVNAAMQGQLRTDAAAPASGVEPGGASGSSTAPQRPIAPDSPGTPEPPAQDELLWTYCVLRARDQHPTEMTGVGPSGRVERVEATQLAALVTRVPRLEFSAEALQRNLNDLNWLSGVARAHESVLEQTLAVTTLVPLRLCTLYESAESVQRMLELEHDAFVEALNKFSGRQEWGVKVLLDRDKLLAQARARSDKVSGLENEPPSEGAGGAYMLRRRLDRHVRELADVLATQVADQVHARLQDWAIDAVTQPPQNPKLSGHEGEMLLNAAYLVEAERTGELRQLVSELEAHHAALGARIELTGPWPPYNFVTSNGATEPS